HRPAPAAGGHPLRHHQGAAGQRRDADQRPPFEPALLAERGGGLQLRRPRLRPEAALGAGVRGIVGRLLLLFALLLPAAGAARAAEFSGPAAPGTAWTWGTGSRSEWAGSTCAFSSYPAGSCTMCGWTARPSASAWSPMRSRAYPRAWTTPRICSSTGCCNG